MSENLVSESLVSSESFEHVSPDLLRRLSRPGPRYTSYPTAPEWTEAIGTAERIQHLQRAEAEGEHAPLSVYFHLPFCRAMCTYCGCNVVIARRQERADLYIDYLIREMDLVVQHLVKRRTISQLHWGGGTPTFLNERQLLRLWQAITQRFTILSEAEVALEIDPVVTSREQLALLRGLGFNRISMGVQDFTPEVQQYIGRLQSVEQTRSLYEYCRFLGFKGINFDLIYGLPKQREETFAQTLATVIEMKPDRVAVFGYAHVPWMRPQQRQFAETLIPQAPQRFRLFALAHRYFLEAGYLQIGLDHFARPEDELAQARLARRLHRNFQGYTVQPASDILAYGITGISDVQRCYSQNVKTLARYYRGLDQGILPVERGWILSAEDHLRRQIINSIMCNFYVDLQQICVPYDLDAKSVFASELQQLGELEDLGLLQRKGLALELTPLGRILVRNVAMIFDTYLRKQPPTAATGKSHPTFSKTI